MKNEAISASQGDATREFPGYCAWQFPFDKEELNPRSDNG